MISFSRDIPHHKNCLHSWIHNSEFTVFFTTRNFQITVKMNRMNKWVITVFLWWCESLYLLRNFSMWKWLMIYWLILLLVYGQIKIVSLFSIFLIFKELWILDNIFCNWYFCSYVSKIFFRRFTERKYPRKNVETSLINKNIFIIYNFSLSWLKFKSII